MVIFGIVDTEKAFTHHIEWGTITLLIGMMILVGITSKSGFFNTWPLKQPSSRKAARSAF